MPDAGRPPRASSPATGDLHARGIDHLHINQNRVFPPGVPPYIYAASRGIRDEDQLVSDLVERADHGIAAALQTI